MNKHTLLFTLLLCLPLLLNAQAELILNRIGMNEQAETVTGKIEAISGNTKMISVAKPTFPLAQHSEKHLLADQLKTTHGTLEKAIFTFADDKLVLVQAMGNVEEVFSSKRKDTAITYLDYKFYPKDKLMVNTKNDMAWILTDGGLHANLFTWENPYFQPEYMTPEEFSKEVPAFLEMGATLETIRPKLEANSTFVVEEELDGADPNAQLQLNGFGVEYMGFPRKVEARFGDEILNVVWILTGKGEEDRIRQALLAEFGEPVFTSPEWEIYNNWTVGLRMDKPEVLLMRQEIGLKYKTSYFKQ